MSCFALKIRSRGIRTMRSSGAHPAEGGSEPTAALVISAPITAKSPSPNSNKSGQPDELDDFIPPACGSGPIRRLKVILVVWFGLIRAHSRPPLTVAALILDASVFAPKMRA